MGRSVKQLLHIAVVRSTFAGIKRKRHFSVCRYYSSPDSLPFFKLSGDAQPVYQITSFKAYLKRRRRNIRNRYQPGNHIPNELFPILIGHKLL